MPSAPGWESRCSGGCIALPGGPGRLIPEQLEDKLNAIRRVAAYLHLEGEAGSWVAGFVRSNPDIGPYLLRL